MSICVCVCVRRGNFNPADGCVTDTKRAEVILSIVLALDTGYETWQSGRIGGGERRKVGVGGHLWSERGWDGVIRSR